MDSFLDEPRINWRVIQDSPEPIQSALKCFMEYHRGIIVRAEFRWLVFQHIRREDLSLLDESLGKIFGESPEGPSPIKSWLQDLLNDADWGFPVFARPFAKETTTADEEAMLATVWERHRAGIATVKDYLEGQDQSEQR